MGRKQFTFYRSFYEAVQELPKKDQVAVVLAICGYALDEKEPELTGTQKAVFSLIRPTLDTSKRKSDNAIGPHKQKKNKEETNQKQTGNKQETNREQTAKEKEKENEYENEYELENDCYKKPRGRFSPPTVDEVRAYCQEKGYPVDPARFVDYYAARGWSYGKGVPMKDWKAAVRTWVKNEPDSPSSPPSPRKYKTVLLDGEWVDVPDEEVEPDA